MARDNDQLRDIEIIPNFLENPAGSVLVKFGSTIVLCTVMVEESVPPWLIKDGEATQGWITSTYNMLPGSGNTRIKRERKGAKGRTQEIERLIGRSLRTAVNLKEMGPRTLWVDCDVLQADGGTRTASITGAWVAVRQALNVLMEKNILDEDPMIRQVAAVSVGMVNKKMVLDLDYRLDSSADVDMNVVMDNDGNLIEVQATGEEAVFTREEHEGLMNLASEGIRKLMVHQKDCIR
jgi:ribonuclease PH